MSSIDSSEGQNLIHVDGGITEISHFDEHIDYTPGYGEISTTMGLLFILVAFAGFFQYLILRNPDALSAKVLKYFLYLTGICLMAFCYSIIPSWEVNKGFYLFIALYAFACGTLFCSYIVCTHHLFKYKRATRALFVKILLAMLLFQVAIQLIIRLGIV